MLNHQIESWAYNILERVANRQPVEDARVELKATWPEIQRAARRIAAHANASQGEPILWLVGVDEEAGTLPGINFTEYASWYDQIQACFDELAPVFRPLNLPINNVTIAALFFETDRAPYVVRVAQGGAVQREVPWRDATGIRTATRAQLLRLLSPLQFQPTIEILGAQIQAAYNVEQDQAHYLVWHISATVFIGQANMHEFALLKHQCHVNIQIGTHHVNELTSVYIDFGDLTWPNVIARRQGVVVRGSGCFHMYLTGHSPAAVSLQVLIQDDAELEFDLQQTASPRTIHSARSVRSMGIGLDNMALWSDESMPHS